MKNICFVNTTRFWGGGEKLHLEYALKFAERGFRVYLAAKKNGPLYEKAKGNKLFHFDVSLKNLSFLNPLNYRKLTRFFKNEKIDTIVISSSPDLKTAALSAKLAGVKNIVYLRGLAVPIKYTPLNKYILKNAVTHIIPNSEETKRMMLKNMIDPKIDEKISVIYHGIDLKEYDDKPIQNLFEKENEVLLGNAGRLTPQKGQKHLINLAELLRNKGLKFKLIIAGDGELKKELQQLIEDKGLSGYVNLPGFIPDMESFMHSIDIFVLSSEWEGFGYVIVEAMAAGKPVIAFDMTSNPEIISNNHTGFLIEYPDIEAMAQKVENLIKNEKLRTSMGIDARKSVENKFQLDDKITEIVNLIQ
ncbi:MAG: glycosyltransferase [Bacteroidales bacterium]|nr:glycosyltransferase [Bacteroidales bacterium]